jgi:hypothetical protein
VTEEERERRNHDLISRYVWFYEALRTKARRPKTTRTNPGSFYRWRGTNGLWFSLSNAVRGRSNSRHSANHPLSDIGTLSPMT